MSRAICRSCCRSSTVVVGLTLLLVSGCASTGGTYRGRRGATERGLASWYGPGFDGQRAASGEIYDMYRLTAAHRTLPFGTKVEVKNRDNGRRVTVRINDRGPFVRGRVIDLSYAAARELDMLGPGVVPVEIRVVGASPLIGGAGGYWVQAGAFRDAGRAKRLYRQLRAEFHGVEMSSDGAWHRVRLGPFSRRKQAERARSELRSRGLDAFLIQL